MSSRPIHSMIASRSSSIDRSMPLRALSAWRRKLSTETPAISWGYWKARKTPALARTSVGQEVMSSPLKRMRPEVTWYSGLPSRVEARVDLPEPLGPIRAWTSPAPTREVDAAEDLDGVLVGGGDVQVLDGEQGGGHGHSLRRPPH